MNIAHQRLLNQRIAHPPFAQPEEVVAWMGAMQGQDDSGARWSIGLRTEQATEQTVEQALIDRRIVRTWPMRGTLHFVAAQDVRWLLHLLTPRMIAQSAGRYRQLELDEASFRRSQEVFINVLQGGKQLSRAQLYQHLEEAGLATTGQRGYHFLVRAAQDGVICFGIANDKQQTFVLLDEWIPPTQPLAREEALAELARRYFTSHGPATLPDLMRWVGITAADAKVGLGAVEKELSQETVDGTVYWSPGQPTDTPINPNEPFLLPGFDEYILGYGNRDIVLDPTYAERICPGGNGVFYPTVVIDGMVVATWKRTVKKKQVSIDLMPFQPLRKDVKNAVAVAAQRYGAFLGLSVQLV